MNEQEPIDPEVAAALKAYLEALAEERCPFCGASIQEEKQIGRCVYAVPCNHRLFQGTAKPKPEKIHPYFQEQLEQEKRERP